MISGLPERREFRASGTQRPLILHTFCLPPTIMQYPLLLRLSGTVVRSTSEPFHSQFAVPA
jgi:hypothetical protein